MVRLNTEKIEAYIKNNNLTKKEFCKRCGICPQTLKRILDQKWKLLRMSTVMKIIQTIDCRLSDFF